MFNLLGGLGDGAVSGARLPEHAGDDFREQFRAIPLAEPGGVPAPSMLRSGDDEGDQQEVGDAVEFPRKESRDPTLVAVLMPFDDSVDGVYEAIKGAASDAGLRCEKASDIWNQDRATQDVLSLLWRARVVVADLTGSDPRVYYELGLAHALPRDCLLIGQSPNDAPPDRRSFSHVVYNSSKSGCEMLRIRLSVRLAATVA